jgi:hypothetical protein
LNSQAAVDNFVATYATTCTDIPVSLGVTVEEGLDISGLDFITSIQGDLNLGGGYTGTEIIGFANLASVTGTIEFGWNQRVEVIAGFNNL